MIFNAQLGDHDLADTNVTYFFPMKRILLSVPKASELAEGMFMPLDSGVPGPK